MSSDANGMVRDAIAAYRAGRKTEARMLLERATEVDEQNEQAWMWLSAVVDTEDDQRICLENVLVLNPNNENAKRGLEMLAKKSGENAPSVSTSQDYYAEDTQADDVIAGASFTSTAPFMDDEVSSDWDEDIIATSSASATHNPAATIPREEYDDWIADMNLGGDSSSSGAFVEEEPQEDDQFLDNLSFMNAFSADSEEVTTLDESSYGDDRLDSMMGGMSDDADMLSGPFGSGGFTDDPLDDFDFDDGGGAFATDDAPAPAAATAQQSPRMSPGVEGKSSRKRSGKQGASSSAFVTDTYSGSVDLDLDPSEYFRAIPKDIQPTRLPGIDETYSTALVMGLVILVLLNIGAIAFLAMNLSA